ncbi:MAG: hypothetical protein JNM27_12405 [Leptospirales bacterium]|nr:hypothetical protein [Leptospirales bacterium]
MNANVVSCLNRSLLILTLCVLASSCTRTLLVQGYKNADTLLYLRADKYFDLSGDQAPFVKDKLKENLLWHRTSELPLVTQFLNETARRGNDQFSTEDAVWIQANVLLMRDRVLTHIYKDTASFLTTVSPEQIKNAREQFNKDGQELYAEFNASEEKKVEFRTKRLVSFVEFWTGGLDHSQKTRAQEIARKLPDPMPTRMAYRATGMGSMEGLVASRANQARMEAFLKSYWLMPGAPPTPISKQFSDLTWVSFRTSLREMDPVLTPEQREKGRQSLIALANDLQKISAQR